VNGAQALGENIADIAGLAIAYDAYKIALGGKPAPVISGLHRRSALLPRFCAGLAGKIPRGRAAAAAEGWHPHPHPFAVEHRAQFRSVVRGVRCEGRSALLATRATGPDLVKKIRAGGATRKRLPAPFTWTMWTLNMVQVACQAAPVAENQAF
jgi:hypothetical protein